MLSRLQMYSTSWCGDCRVLKRFLAAEAVGWEEVDIDADPAAAAELVAATGKRGIPYLKWEGAFHKAYPLDPPALRVWLAERGLCGTGPR
ncbi:MAG: glutaredoxin domain-containing protein [bacterium]|jgi:mycoredoxin|nr:glutaredoxin domain-containing protein [bacterium]